MKKAETNSMLEMTKAIHAYADRRADKIAAERLRKLTVAINVRSNKAVRNAKQHPVYHADLVFTYEGEPVIRSPFLRFIEGSVWAQEYVRESDDDPLKVYGVTATSEGRDLVRRLNRAYREWQRDLRKQG